MAYYSLDEIWSSFEVEGFLNHLLIMFYTLDSEWVTGMSVWDILQCMQLQIVVDSNGLLFT